MNSDGEKSLVLVEAIKERLSALNNRFLTLKDEKEIEKADLLQKGQIIAKLEEEKLQIVQLHKEEKQALESKIYELEERVAELNAEIINFKDTQHSLDRNKDEIKDIVREIDDCIGLIKNSL